MGTVPTSKSSCSYWGQLQKSYFLLNAAAIGLSPAQATGFEDAADNLNDAYLKQEDAKQTAKNKTAIADSEWAQFRDMAAECLAAIKAKAEASTDPAAIYNLAHIDPPAPPTPVGPPTDVTNLSVNLQNDGSLKAEWKGTTRGGQFFTIWRKLSTQSWTQIGSTAQKFFVDNTLTPGTTAATYMVRSHRGGQSSPGCEPVNIVFGAQLPQAA